MIAGPLESGRPYGIASEVTEADLLLDQLQGINSQLLSLQIWDPCAIGQAIKQRGQLARRVGDLQRSARAPRTEAYHAELEQALEVSDIAVHRLLSPEPVDAIEHR
jgi:hypothetical protein